LTLYVDATSPASAWVRLVLAEKDVDKARVEVARADRPNEDFLLLNPRGLLPALADREGLICGARVIAEYLDERYPHPPLMPLGPAPRARVRTDLQRLEDEVFAGLAGLRAGAALPVALADALVRAYRERDVRAAADYSLADCAWTAAFWCLRRADVALPAEVRGLRAWAAALLARPAALKGLPS